MKTNLTYCTIKLRQCPKQQNCKRWIMNYPTIEQDKMIYDGNVWFITGNECLEAGFELYINKDKE